MFNYSSLNDKFIQFQEKLDLKNKLIDLFFMSLYLTTFVFINICIFYR